jgi:hypothetical protein
MQATVVTPTSSNSKDDSISKTVHNNRNASNSRKESYNRNENNYRTANTVGTPAKAGMLAKDVKPATACREISYRRDTINIRDDSSSRGSSNIMDVNSSNAARIRQQGSQPATYSRDASNIQQGCQQHTAGKPATFSRDASNSSRNSQRTLATSAETKGTSRTSKAEGRPATAGIPKIEEMPTTALAYANN